MSNIPASTPPDAKLAALLGKRDRESRDDNPQKNTQPQPQINSTHHGASSCATCRAIRTVAERARALRDAIQHRKAIEALHVHRLRQHAPERGDGAC
ncbi:hypothetical protein [Streptomyces buecherae]|uniref:hypothetical protein n=1 Tax=Streptomyces buecherae TaxID=2763006 RepID=UPI00365CEACA